MPSPLNKLSVEIAIVSTNNEIDSVATLATEIWTEYFTPIIGGSQGKYMLMKFQSSDAIKSQITSGSKYYLAKEKNEYVAYLGLIPNLDDNKMMLSKIYLKSSTRGKGVGKSLLDYVEDKCVSENFSSLWLTVNKFNDGPISWYKRRGFLVIDEAKKDIGGGFFMDDYIMEKKF